MPRSPESPLLGSHMSIAGGIEKSLQRGERLGCTAIQIFTKNSNQWNAPPLSDESVNRFLTVQKNTGIEKVIAHTSYLINLAGPEGPTRQKSIEALADELERAEILRLDGLVLHPGSHLGQGRKTGIRHIANAINRIFSHTLTDQTLLLLETTAGQGTGLGHRFEDLADIIEGVENQPRVGVCLDTCHLFAAGYEIQTKDGYQAMMAALDRQIGLSRVHAIHLNDSKKPLGSRVDRHEHIGKGQLGLEAFRLLMNDRRFSKIPKILETPKDKNLTEDRRNLNILRSLLK